MIDITILSYCDPVGNAFFIFLQKRFIFFSPEQPLNGARSSNGNSATAIRFNGCYNNNNIMTILIMPLRASKYGHKLNAV